MRLRDFADLVFLLTFAALVAAYGEPRPLGLAVGGASAATILFAAIRKLDRE